MSEPFSTLWDAASALLGVAVFVLVIGWVARTHARMWRLVAARYAGAGPEAASARKLDTIVVTRRGRSGEAFTVADFRQYPGTIIALTPTGLRLTAIPIPPLNLMCPALLLPFDELALVRTSWALWPEPFALRMRRLPDIEIILARDTVQWLRTHTDQGPFGFA